MKAWELARLILPSISSRAPYKTHLPAPQQDHGIFFLFRRTPRFLWQGISGSLDFTSIRKTRRNSRDGLASPLSSCVSVRWSSRSCVRVLQQPSLNRCTPNLGVE